VGGGSMATLESRHQYKEWKSEGNAEEKEKLRNCKSSQPSSHKTEMPYGSVSNQYKWRWIAPRGSLLSTSQEMEILSSKFNFPSVFGMLN
jgi:hypothetical protein